MKKQITEYWFIDSEGTLRHETLRHHVTKNRLKEIDWLYHMESKLTPQQHKEFIYAYLSACRYHNIEEVSILVPEFL